MVKKSKQDPLELILARPDASEYYNKWVAVSNEDPSTVVLYGDADYFFKEMGKRKLDDKYCIFLVPDPRSIIQ